MQEKSRNLSGKQGEESMIWDKMSCINGWMVKFNLVISLKYGSEEKGSSLCKCSILLGFIYVKKAKRFVILSFDKSSERNLSCFFDLKNPGG